MAATECIRNKCSQIVPICLLQKQKTPQIVEDKRLSVQINFEIEVVVYNYLTSASVI